MSSLGHSLMQDDRDAYAAAECGPSHVHLSVSGFSHHSDHKIQILYKIVSAPKTHHSVRIYGGSTYLWSLALWQP